MAARWRRRDDDVAVGRGEDRQERRGAEQRRATPSRTRDLHDVEPARRRTGRHAPAGRARSARAAVRDPADQADERHPDRGGTRRARSAGCRAARSPARRRTRPGASACPGAARSRAPRSRARPARRRRRRSRPARRRTTRPRRRPRRWTRPRRAARRSSASRSSGTIPRGSGSPPASRTSAASAERGRVAYLADVELAVAGGDDLVAGRDDRHPRPRVDAHLGRRPPPRAARGPARAAGGPRAAARPPARGVLVGAHQPVARRDGARRPRSSRHRLLRVLDHDDRVRALGDHAAGRHRDARRRARPRPRGARPITTAPVTSR